MELAAANRRRAGRLTLAAIARVYTLAHAAEMLGEDGDWLHEPTGDMFPGDGRLWIVGVGVGVGEYGRPGLINFGIGIVMTPSERPRVERPGDAHRMRTPEAWVPLEIQLSWT